MPESGFAAWRDTTFNSRGEAIRLQLLVPSIGGYRSDRAERQCRHAGTRAAVKPPVLRTVSDIRRLPPVEARRGYPVHLRAIVTHDDESRGECIHSGRDSRHLHGERGRAARGRTARGGDRSDRRRRLRARRRQSPCSSHRPADLPEPVALPLSELFTRPVRQSVRRGGRHRSDRRPPGGRTSISWSRQDPIRSGRCSPIPATCRFRLHSSTRKSESAARAAPIFNERRQLLGIRLQVPGLAAHHRPRTGACRLAALPVQPINTLMQFRPGTAAGHRVRIQGIATLRRSNGAVFIKDATGGLRRSDAAGAFPSAPGPARRRGIRRARRLPARVAERRIPEAGARRAAAARAHHGRRGAERQLPRAAGRKWKRVLVDQTENSAERVLTLRAGRRTFNAFLENTSGARQLNDVRPGSLVQVTGVALVEPDKSISDSTRIASGASGCCSARRPTSSCSRARPGGRPRACCGCWPRCSSSS